MVIPGIHFVLLYGTLFAESEDEYFSKGKPVETLGRKAAGLNPGKIGIR
jgi:hypothetical protein